MRKHISIPYFPAGVRFVTPLFFSGGIYLGIIGHFIWGILAFILGIVILNTRYVTEINLKERTYRDFLHFLWIPFNEDTGTFKSIDRIVITKGNYAQTINTRAQSRQLDWSDYTGTLIFDNSTLELLTRNDKRELIMGLKEFAGFLNVGVEDRTTTRHFLVDLKKY